jgi:hypothetical protein
MSGRGIRISGLRTLDYTNLATSSSQQAAIAERIDATQFTQADLLVRVSSSTIPANAKIEVILFCDGWHAEEPTVVGEYLKARHAGDQLHHGIDRAPVRVVPSPAEALAEVGGVNVHAKLVVDGREPASALSASAATSLDRRSRRSAARCTATGGFAIASRPRGRTAPTPSCSSHSTSSLASARSSRRPDSTCCRSQVPSPSFRILIELGRCFARTRAFVSETSISDETRQ